MVLPLARELNKSSINDFTMNPYLTFNKPTLITPEAFGIMFSELMS